jgi:hypothetical protein
MKPAIFRSPVLIVAIFILTSMTNATIKTTPPKTQHPFNDFFTKRSFVISSITELETKFKTKFNFFQRLKIQQVQKKFARQLKNDHLLDGCDTIKLKNGEEISAIVSEVNPGEVKYKKCDNKTGPTYAVKRSNISMITYANGSKDYFGNEKPAGINNDDIINSEIAQTDPIAIASIASLIVGVGGMLLSAPILAILIPVGVVLGFVSRNRIKNSKGKLKGNSLALAAIIGGFIAIALVALGLILYVSFLTSL